MGRIVEHTRAFRGARGHPGRLGPWLPVSGPILVGAWVACPALIRHDLQPTELQISGGWRYLVTWQSWGQGFEPPQLHHSLPGVTGSSVAPSFFGRSARRPLLPACRARAPPVT